MNCVFCASSQFDLARVPPLPWKFDRSSSNTAHGREISCEESSFGCSVKENCFLFTETAFEIKPL